MSFISLSHPRLPGRGGSLRFVTLRTGRTKVLSVARRGETIVGLTSQHNLVLIAPKLQRRQVLIRVTSHWHLDAIECCSDLGVGGFDSALVEEIRASVQEERDRTSFREDARDAVRTLNKLGIPVPSKLQEASK